MTATASSLFETFRRPVREQASRRKLDVEFEIVGGDVRIDRRTLEVLRGPLGHLLRNSVDHGFESPEDRATSGKGVPKIVLAAREDGERLEVSVSDDGRGIDPAAVRAAAVDRGIPGAGELDDAKALELIWRPGFSTARKLSETSGRGVGLDVVKAQVLAAGGEVAVESTVGKGTRFVLRLPREP
jgi:chemotaxis protein histidine kinase CheA